MEPAILKVRFPLGWLPARGYRCPVCGEEELALSEAHVLDELAHRLGLFGVEQRQRRKLQRTGNSVTVSLDPRLLEEALRGAGPGDMVEVGRQGDRIVILPASKAAARARRAFRGRGRAHGPRENF